MHPSIPKVITVIVGGSLSFSPTKGNVRFSILTIKYAIRRQINIYNWLPGTHTSHVTKTLTTLLFQIGTRQHFNLRRLVFDHILRHDESLALKLGLGYSSFIFGILKDQSGSLLLCTDVLSGPPSKIRLNPKLFQGLHKTDT